MRLLIDCSNIQVGGGIQVALSFLHDLTKINSENEYIVVLSPQMSVKLQDRRSFGSNFKFYDLPRKNYKNIFKRNRLLRQIELVENSNVVFTVFGPSYYKSSVPKIVGYAIPHYIYKDSPYFSSIKTKAKMRLKLKELIQINAFKTNSSFLIFETSDVQDKFCQLFKYDSNKTYVVSNTLNEIFYHREKWKNNNYNFHSKNSILVLSANYPHKNLSIIPKIIDTLINTYHIDDFKFIISLTKEELHFDDKYDLYIEYLGFVPLEKLPSLYNSVDILFMPTLLEVFSATYLEAMYMKVPIVTSDMSFARDICGEGALYYSPLSSIEAANKIIELITNDILKKEIVETASENFKRFPSSMVRTLQYLEICKRHSL